jgi:glycosyltransferase involved in cell wall biosynthesis
MRVGLLVYALDRPLSGISRYAIELARALVGLEDAPEVILLTAGGAGPLRDLDVPMDRLPGCARLPALLTVGNGLIAAASRRHRLDVLHDTTGVTPFALGGSDARTVVTIHDVIPVRYPGVSTRLDELVYRRWLPVMLPRVDHVVTVSECSRTDIANSYAVPVSRISAIPLAANARFRRSSVEEVTRVRQLLDLPERYLLLLGSVEARKNARRVFEALQALSDLGCTIPLVVTGELKWQFREVLESLEASGLRDSVHFTGYVEDSALPALYSGALALLFPSLYEGFGLPVLEAMACGAPVVCSMTTSLPEVAGDAALLVDPLDVGSIAGAIECLVRDDALRARLSAAGLRRAASFSWEKTARRTNLVYQSLR